MIHRIFGRSLFLILGGFLFLFFLVVVTGRGSGVWLMSMHEPSLSVSCLCQSFSVSCTLPDPEIIQCQSSIVSPVLSLRENLETGHLLLWMSISPFSSVSDFFKEIWNLEILLFLSPSIIALIRYKKSYYWWVLSINLFLSHIPLAWLLAFLLAWINRKNNTSK